MANAAQPHSDSTQDDHKGRYDFTAEQVQRLLSLIETPKSNLDKLLGNETWLLNSGASCHMIGDGNLLYNTYEIDMVPVDLSNEMQTLATKRDLVLLNSKLVLQDVLSMPNLRCRVISIAQLIEDLYCTVTFTPKLCVIQDLITRNLIVVVKPRKGIYYYKGAVKDGVQVNKFTTYELWHHRLPHPSH